MPKFPMDINGVNDGAAEGREGWGGPIPPTGAYEGILKTVSLDTIGSNSEKYAGKTKLNIMVELQNTPNGAYDGFPAWGSLNLIDPSIPYVNQFLQSLTDGSDEEFEKIKKAFYGGFDVDERQKHVTAIGPWKVNSPNGELPIRVALKKTSRFNDETKQTYENSRIDSFLLGAGSVPNGGGAVKPQEAPEEEAAEVELESDDDESILDDDE